MKNVLIFAILGMMVTGCEMDNTYDSECRTHTYHNGDSVTRCKDINAVYENYDDKDIVILDEGNNATVYDLEDDTSTEIEITRDI